MGFALNIFIRLRNAVNNAEYAYPVFVEFFTRNAIELLDQDCDADRHDDNGDGMLVDGNFLIVVLRKCRRTHRYLIVME
jgi:hypothetical protein